MRLIASTPASRRPATRPINKVGRNPSRIDAARNILANRSHTGVYAFLAQICIDNGISLTAAPEAAISATSGGWPSQITGGPWGPGSAGWSSWASCLYTALPGPPNNWNGGPWGGPGNGWNSKGPWGGPNCVWSTWTAGWGPWSTWTGVWSGCGTTTAAPQAATVTTTINGQVVTGTTFGVQALQASSSGASSKAVIAPLGTRALVLAGALVGGVLAAAIAL